MKETGTLGASFGGGSEEIKILCSEKKENEREEVSQNRGGLQKLAEELPRINFVGEGK